MSLQQVADSFWTKVQDPEIADVFFGHARWLQRNEHHTGPTDPVAAKHYKGELAHAAAIARSRSVDPEILRKFAKDTRVTVRQNLLENPNTPRDVLVDLMVWKLERNDIDRVECVERLTVTELLTVLERFADKYSWRRTEDLDLPAWGIVPKLAAELTLAVRLARIAPISLTAIIAKAAHGGALPGVSLSEILDARPEATEKALHLLLTAREHLSSELAQRWRQWRDHPDTRLYRHFGFDTKLFDTVEEGAADILVGGDVAQVHTAVLNGATSSVLADAFPALDLETLRHVVDVLGRCSLCPRAEAALVDRVLDIGQLGKFPIHAVLEDLRHPLEDAKIVALLRAGGFQTLSRWLTVTNPVNGPRAGILTMLTREPKWRARTHEGVVDLTSEDMILPLVQGAHAHPAIAREVVALHDAYIGSHLGHSSVAGAVYPILVEAFDGSEKRAAWETFLTLASDWSDTFTGLVEAVHGLLGITPKDPADTHDVLDTTGVHEQLTLI